MEMTQGGDRAQPTNFTVNDYGTGLHLAASIVLAMLARARGVPAAVVESSLMVTATVWEAEHASLLAAGRMVDGAGPDRTGPSLGRRLYEADDGWVVVCAVTAEPDAAVAAAVGADAPTLDAVATAVRSRSVADVLAAFSAAGVPAARSVHPTAVPDDPQVRARGLLATVRHPVAGALEQVGIPFRLSVDAPAVKSAAPVPGRRR